MRYLVAAIGVLTIGIAAGILFFLQSQTANPVQIRLSSEPFPLNIGPNTLLISLTHADGTPVENAAVEIAAHMHLDGMEAVTNPARSRAPGEYEVPVVWPMAGQWLVDVVARLPDQPTPAQDQFQVFVYAMPVYDTGGQTRYRSVREAEAARSSNPEQEMWIVIPLGTQAMIRTGQGDSIIPPVIRLKVSGQNVLVIRNDDIADHTVGPFFVRAGETIRQQFTVPAEYPGTCSISHGAYVNIVVES